MNQQLSIFRHFRAFRAITN